MMVLEPYCICYTEYLLVSDILLFSLQGIFKGGLLTTFACGRQDIT